MTCLNSVSKKQPSTYCENMEKIIESKMTYLESESEPDSNFAVNSASEFDSHSDSDSNSALMNLAMFVNLVMFVNFFFYSHYRINSYAGNASVMFVFFWYFIT